jgi:hypothetical protein
MKLNINGTVYDWDMDHITARDAMMLKTATGFNLKPFVQALTDVDPDCMIALAWVVQTQAGVKGTDGEPLKLADVDFDLGAFLVQEPEDEADPTVGGLSSGNGATPDSTSPEPSTSTA